MALAYEENLYNLKKMKISLKLILRDFQKTRILESTFIFLKKFERFVELNLIIHDTTYQQKRKHLVLQNLLAYNFAEFYSVRLPTLLFKTY